MFRNLGETRTLSHNLQIASLLSFVAGLVNVTGFLAVQQLTTNVTGHFAFMIEEVYAMKIQAALTFMFFILSFFLGSFFSNLLVEIVSRKSERFIYVIPVFIEAMLLAFIALYGGRLMAYNDNLIAFGLLFSMGLQNSLVTTISNSVVRTTHLTGLFTDLGIELSQLLFYKTKEQREKLFQSIRLRLTIICFFFIGGITAGAMYGGYGIQTLLLGTLLLCIGLVYDSIKFRIIQLRKKMPF